MTALLRARSRPWRMFAKRGDRRRETAPRQLSPAQLSEGVERFCWLHILEVVATHADVAFVVHST